MKTVVGLADERDGFRAARWVDSEEAAVAVLALALLSGCDSLWRSYLEPCDPMRPLCMDTAKPEPQLLPSNGIDPAWFGEAKVELIPTEDLVVDTDQGTVTTAVGNRRLMDVSYHQLAPADCGRGWMVGVGVFGFSTIRIPDGVRVRFAGSRAAALIAPGPIEIDGLLDLRGGMAECTDRRCGGPGGFAGGFVQFPAQRGEGPGAGAWGYGMGGVGDEAGGGGAGACGRGGKGGDAGATSYPGGSGGPAYQQPTLIPLCGGSGGGSGGPGTSGGDPGQRGGGGGGAIQIVSQKSVSIGSTSATPSGIQAGGGGGQGDQGVNFNDGGGGGGSGGAILIEAPSISVSSGAVLAVNGGGGAGGNNGGVPCTNGESALLSAKAAAGGTGMRFGGAGGAGSTLHGSDAGGAIGDGGAGGGGGVGRIRLNSLNGTVVLGGEQSPEMGECLSTGRLILR